MASGSARRALASAPGVLALTAALLAGAWLGATALVLLAGGVLAAIGLGRLWSGLALWRLGCTSTLTATRAFPGDEIALKVRVENRKPLPVAWAEVACPLLDAGEESAVLDFSIGAYRAVERMHRFRCRRRGIWTIGPITITTGDPFGLFPRHRLLPGAGRVVVYPRLVPLEALGLPARYPLGETRLPEAPVADLTRTVGVRDYTPGTPLKHVHWKASARRAGLQARVFEASTRRRVLLLFDGDSFGPGEDFELAASAVATLAVDLGAIGCPVGLLTGVAGAQPVGTAIALPPIEGADATEAILTALAGLRGAPGVATPDMLAEEVRKLAWGDTLVAVTCGLAAESIRQLAAFRASGIAVAALFVGDAPMPEARLACRRLERPRPPSDVAGLPEAA